MSHITSIPEMRPASQEGWQLTFSSGIICFKVETIYHTEALQSNDLASFLNHDAGAILGDGAQKSHRWTQCLTNAEIVNNGAPH